MPYKSDKQRRYIQVNKPKLAKKWAKKGKGYVGIKKNVYERGQDLPAALRVIGGEHLQSTLSEGHPANVLSQSDLDYEAEHEENPSWKHLPEYDEAMGSWWFPTAADEGLRMRPGNINPQRNVAVIGSQQKPDWVGLPHERNEKLHEGYIYGQIDPEDLMHLDLGVPDANFRQLREALAIHSGEYPMQLGNAKSKIMAQRLEELGIPKTLQSSTRPPFMMGNIPEERVSRIPPGRNKYGARIMNYLSFANHVKVLVVRGVIIQV